MKRASEWSPSPRLLLATVTAASVFGQFGMGALAADDPALPPVDKAPQVASADSTKAPDGLSDDEITFVLNGFPISGRPVLPADEKDFRVKLKETGEVLTFHWDNLISNGDDSERRRVQKLFGIEVHGAHTGWVGEEKLPAVRLHLASGKTLDVLALPAKDRPVQGLLAFKTAGSPLMLIHETEVKSKEPIEAFESDFYTAKEIYDRWLLEKPPGTDDASAHLELAKKCANMELYRESLDQLKMAEIIDPRTEERNKDMRVQIIKADADKQTQDLYQKMLQRCLARDYFAAQDYIEKLDRNFPNSEFKTRWDAKRAEIEQGTKIEQKKQVIFRAYIVALDLIQNEVYKKIKIDKKGNVVPSVPGKQVTTKSGDIFRGTLSPPDANGGFAMKVGDMNLTIAQKEILSITDIDLSQGVGEVHPTFDDMKDYVCDTKRPDGLKAMMVAQISKVLKMPEKDVKAIFDARLDMKAIYEDGHLSREDRYVSIHDARWGKGGWLRDGSKPPAPAAQRRPGIGKRQRQGRQWQRQRERLRNSNSSSWPTSSSRPDPEISDDPNVWWLAQTPDTQIGILEGHVRREGLQGQAGLQRKLHRMRGPRHGRCPRTGRQDDHPYRCQKCRGLAVLFNIVYQ